MDKPGCPKFHWHLGGRRDRTFQQKMLPNPLPTQAPWGPAHSLLPYTESPDHPEGTFHGIMGLGLGRWGIPAHWPSPSVVLPPVLQHTVCPGESRALGGSPERNQDPICIPLLLISCRAALRPPHGTQPRAGPFPATWATPPPEWGSVSPSVKGREGFRDPQSHPFSI